MPGIKRETKEYSLFLEDERIYPANSSKEDYGVIVDNCLNRQPQGKLLQKANAILGHIEENNIREK